MALVVSMARRACSAADQGSAGPAMNYWFDAEDRIAMVDDAWATFAAANDAPHLTADRVVGEHLSDFISDRTTVQIWKLLLARARQREISIVIRCDAPSVRRVISLDLAPHGNLTRVTSTVVSEEGRPRMELLCQGRSHGGSSRLIMACGWCRKFQLGTSWLEVEDFVAATRVLELETLPAVSHGICEPCAERVFEIAGSARN